MKPVSITAAWLVILAAGCAGIPHKPYWENARWINTMVNAIQHHLQYPRGALEQNDPAGWAIVQFTYAAGEIRNVVIVKSTGYQILDAAIATEMPEIKLPLPEGTDTKFPHRFQIPVEISSSVRDKFYVELSEDIKHHAHYPRASIAQGDQGIVTVAFEYRNGMILDPKIVLSSRSPTLDKSVIDELSQLKAPPPPSWARNKILHFSVPVIFCLGGGRPCTTVVSRYVPDELSDKPGPELCSDIGFDYGNGKISDVHLTHSSGNADIDKDALSRISRGDFPSPSENQ
ncbi:MAG: energy transducer TonB, partial [Gammaproteobacteria bacterium]